MIFRTRLKASHNLIDLTPLVDVIFLMLIFFIITSDIMPLKSLNIESPTLDKNSLPLTTQLIVAMDADHGIYVGSQKNSADLSSIKDQLLDEIALFEELSPNTTPAVVLSIDRRAQYGPFLKLFSIVQECSPRVRLVYQPQEEQ